MHLYLMRHGIAMEREDWEGAETERPLTPEGFARTRAVAKALQQRKLLKIEAIWSSPLRRALQTAQVMQEFFPVPLLESPALACGASVAGLQKAFRGQQPPQRLLLTGHEPDLGQILAELTGRSWEPFKKAAIAYASGEFSADAMKFHWYHAPKDLLQE